MTIIEPKLPKPSDLGTTVSFHKKFGGGTKVHKEESEKVRTDNGVTKKSRARVVVDILACPIRKEAMAKATQLDGWIREHTSPWGNDGRRWVPNTKKEMFDKHWKEEKKEIDALMEKHFDPANWARLKNAWEIESGKLSKAGIEFPDLATYQAKYEVSVDPGPCVDMDQIWKNVPASLSPEQKERFVKDVRATEQRRLMGTVRDLARRITETISEVVEIGKYGTDADGKKVGIYRDSKITNVHILADALGHLNITGDPEIEAVRKKMIDEIASKNPETLREDKAARDKVVRSAKDILARAGQFGRRKE